MKSFTVDLQSLLTVVAVVVDADGALVAANAGFLRMLPAAVAQSAAPRVGRFFIQPSFTALLAMSPPAAEPAYSGLMTFGDYAGQSRTLRGHAWRTEAGLRVLAEYDIADLERQNDAILDMNRQSSVVQDSLARANLVLKQRAVENVEAAMTDALTGVGNRRRLDEALAAEINRAGRSGDALSAIMADVDHFKRVNDQYGHAAGDKVLARIGALLRSNTRLTDVVARFGGEEFVVLLPRATLAQAMAKAEKFRVALSANLIEPLPAPVTASFGVAELAPAESAESLLGRADAALYRAKQGGRDRVEG